MPTDNANAAEASILTALDTGALMIKGAAGCAFFATVVVFALIAILFGLLCG